MTGSEILGRRPKIEADAYRPLSIIAEMQEEFQPEFAVDLHFPFDERTEWRRLNPGADVPEADWLEIADQEHLDNRLNEWSSGADGAARFIREALWFPFPGKPAPQRVLLARHQRELLEALEDPSIDTVLIAWPKRHSKTMTNACVGIWRACCHRYQGIGVLSTSERNAVTTLYGYEYKLASTSPLVHWLCGGQRNLHERSGIYVAYTGSAIRPLPCRRAAVAGNTYTLFQESERAETKDPSAGEMGASQTEISGAQTWIDSSAAPEGNPWTETFRAGCREASTFVHFIHADETPRDKRPLMQRGYDRLTTEVTCPWMRPGFVESRRSKVLPVDFRHWHANEFGGDVGKLFPAAKIAQAKKPYLSEYPSLWDLLKLAKSVGATGVTCCGGFDRSEPTAGPGGDYTAWAVVARINVPETTRRKVDGKGSRVHPELPSGWNYLVVRMVRDRNLVIDLCERQIDRDNQELRLAGALLESHLAGDIALHMQARDIPVKLIAASATNYGRAFVLYRDLVDQGRFHGSPAYTTLWQDMRDFDISKEENNRITYGASKHAKRRNARGRTIRDDTVKAVGYALLAFADVDSDAAATPGAYTLTDEELSEVARGAKPRDSLGGRLGLQSEEELRA